MNWLKTLLLILALGHLLFGAYALLVPDAAARIVSLQPMTPGATGEIRAIFGGLIVGMGLVIVRGAVGGDRGKQWLLAASVAYFGLVLGRIVSLVLDGAVAHTLMAGAFEGLLGVLLFYAAIDIARPGTGTARGAAPESGAVATAPPVSPSPIEPPSAGPQPPGDDSAGYGA